MSPPARRRLEEFLAADIIVIGAPMYNFSIPSQLKAWIDRLAVAGKTFRYTENGPEGLAGGKKVIVASSRGGFYGPETPVASLDHQENYLRGVFGFFGITDVTSSAPKAWRSAANARQGDRSRQGRNRRGSPPEVFRAATGAPPRKITRRGAPAIRRAPCGEAPARRAGPPRAFP